MNNKKNFSEKLYEDEAICFIANRHHITPLEVVQYFLAWEGTVSKQEKEPTSFLLEENEMEILRGLIGMYNK